MTCGLFGCNVEGAVESTDGEGQHTVNQSGGVMRAPVSALAAAFGLPDTVAKTQPLKRLAEHGESGCSYSIF